MPSRFQHQVRQAVLSSLELEPLTVNEIALRNKLNYHSTRNAVMALVDEGLVKAQFTGSARNIKYTIGSDDGPNNLIPVIATGTNRLKVPKLQVMHKTPVENSAVMQAYRNLPMHIARLMRLAKRLHNNSGEAATTLQVVRTQMENDVQALEALVSVYHQILDSAAMWNPDILKRMPNDIEWDDDLNEETYKHFFKDE